MPRLTAEKWEEVRREWENDQKATFVSLAETYGIDQSNINRRAAKEGWAKHGKLSDINEAAQRKADRLQFETQNETQNANAETQARGKPYAIPKIAESEDLRAAVIIRHRAEIAELEVFRKTALMAMKQAHEQKDKGAWQIAKLAADTAKSNIQALEIKQSVERAAWGMDTPEAMQQAVQTIRVEYEWQRPAGGGTA